MLISVLKILPECCFKVAGVELFKQFDLPLWKVRQRIWLEYLKSAYIIAVKNLAPQKLFVSPWLWILGTRIEIWLLCALEGKMDNMIRVLDSLSFRATKILALPKSFCFIMITIDLSWLGTRIEIWLLWTISIIS